MAKRRGISPRQFRKRFVRKVGRRDSLTERPNGDCVMLEDGRCTVYAEKPQRCTTYPFWKPVLEYPEEWESEAARCEGIGQGDLYGPEEIEAMLAGDPGPLVEKHARPPEQPVTSSYVDGKRVDPSVAPEEGPDWDSAFADLERLYAQLDRELPRYEFTCSASGRCCDFDAYGHRLYVSTLEAAWFFEAAPEAVNDDPGACPAWGADRLCKARDGRMLGCRTYFCPPYPVEGPEALHERYMAQVKAIHDRHRIPYAYKDVVAWREERPSFRE